MKRTGLICVCLLAWTGVAIAEEEAEEDKKAPAPETFIDDEGDAPKLGAPGPWDLHPAETPVQAGPWAVDRRGAAPVDVQRDGSAREPAPPRASWGGTQVDSDGEDSPWQKSAKQKGLKMAPLGAHFPVRILGHEPDALLLEIPMLVAQKPGDFKGEGYWLIVEFFMGKKKVGDHRIMVNKHSLAMMGPTHAWVKAMIPTSKPQGEITIRVLRMERASSQVQPMFERKVKFGK